MDEEDEKATESAFHYYKQCHIINKLLTKLVRAALGNIGPRSWQYGPRPLGQYSPVRPSRSVSKQLLLKPYKNPTVRQ